MSGETIPDGCPACGALPCDWVDNPGGRIAIEAIRIYALWESCQRTTFFVDLVSSEGFTITVASHRTGSVYTNFEGLALEEARDRALIDADTWGDFLGIKPDAYTYEGSTFEPSMLMRPYATRRELAARKLTASAPTVGES